jgi:hypothetical protein
MQSTELEKAQDRSTDSDKSHHRRKPVAKKIAKVLLITTSLVLLLCALYCICAYVCVVPEANAAGQTVQVSRGEQEHYRTPMRKMASWFGIDMDPPCEEARTC